MESKQNKNQLCIIDTEYRLVVARGEGREVGQGVQISSDKINKSWGSNDSITAYLKVAKRINVKSFHHRKNL